MSPIRSSAGPLALILVALSACNSDPRVASKRYVANGNQYFDRGKYKEASLLYRRGLAKDAKSAEAWYRLGLTNNKLALYGEARRDFTRATDLDPANTDALAKLGDLDLLLYALDPRSNQAALADLKDVTARLLKRNKQSYDGLRYTAEIALIQKDLKTAIQKFEEANQSRPDQPELVLALAQALFADHQDERAETLAADLISKEKTYGPIYDLLYVNYLFHAMRGLDYVALRYFNVYGPRMDIYGLYTEVLIRWMERIEAGQPPLILGDGTQTMDFVFTEDIARANLLAASAEVTDEVFNIGSGTETSLAELAHALLRAMDS